MTDTAHLHEHAPEPLVVQVLTRTRPPLDPARLGDEFARWSIAPAHVPGPLATFGWNESGARITVAYRLVAAPSNDEPVHAALSQTWDWPDATAAAERAAWAIVVRLEVDGELDRMRRLRIARAATQAAVATSDAVAIHWVSSQRLVSPSAWKESLEHGGGPADHAINVRLFRVADGRPGEGVMDTLGLGAFGLPDLECHFHGLDLGEVAQLLFAYGEYLFEKGDVLDEEALVRGLASHEEWECVRGPSAVAPAREVIELLPDAAHRAS